MLTNIVCAAPPPFVVPPEGPQALSLMQIFTMTQLWSPRNHGAYGFQNYAARDIQVSWQQTSADSTTTNNSLII